MGGVRGRKGKEKMMSLYFDLKKLIKKNKEDMKVGGYKRRKSWRQE